MDTRPYRSVLYIPGSKERALDKATGLAVDAIIFDLEDAVAPDEKANAREMLAAALVEKDYGNRVKIVRINGFDTAWADDDLAVIARAAPEAVLLPKVNTAADVQALADAGADIIAYDATDRRRPVTTQAILDAIHRGGALAMADCSSLEDGQRAMAQGAAILGTTLSGYTDETAGRTDGVDFDLIRAFKGQGAFVMAEGRVNTPQLAGEAIAAGADAVTAGTALTRLEHVTGWFHDAIKQAAKS